MTELAAARRSLPCILIACAAPTQAHHAAPPRDVQSSVPACRTQLCRLREYAALFQQRAVVELEDDAQSIRTRPACAPLHWRRISSGGPSGSAFDQTIQMLWMGRDAALVTETARLAAMSSMFDREPTDDSAWQQLESGQLAVITLESEIIARPEWHAVHDIDPPEPLTAVACSIVYMDSCTGRVGYVCSGSDVLTDHEGYPEPPDGRYVFELELDPCVTIRGLFDGAVRDVMPSPFLPQYPPRCIRDSEIDDDVAPGP